MYQLCPDSKCFCWPPITSDRLESPLLFIHGVFKKKSVLRQSSSNKQFSRHLDLSTVCSNDYVNI